MVTYTYHNIALVISYSTRKVNVRVLYVPVRYTDCSIISSEAVDTAFNKDLDPSLYPFLSFLCNSQKRIFVVLSFLN